MNTESIGIIRLAEEHAKDHEGEFVMIDDIFVEDELTATVTYLHWGADGRQGYMSFAIQL